ncbi:MAG: ATP-binding protein [Bacteroidota bacterium]|nr:ATP-binding protein [Bacteroidota bacterium]
MARAIDNSPKADHLMGSLRSMGYSFESAIADIIDNSVSAGAKEIHINFPTTALETFVYILDDGYGMTKTEHFNAMRYGSSASESERDETDLGRYGLGMKSASLSQCRVLTVLTKRSKIISGYRWDYKHILKCKKWEVFELDEQDINKVKGVEELKAQKSGTLVVWEDFDILEKASGGQVYASLNDYKDKIIKHVGLTFHRFINAPRVQKITFYINNHKVKGLDPFLENNPKTTRKKEVSVALMDSSGVERQIWVQPFVLPFHKDLTDADIEKLGGIEDMRTKQGYYVYRNNRLIIYGTWFGLPRNELTKNARIRVDIPNTLDDIWKLDVRKQSATIPKAIQNQLNRKVREAMDISVRQQTHRGRKNNVDDKIDYLWNRIEGRDSHFFYEINRESKLFKFVEEQIPEEAKSYVDMLLEELERNVPIQQMYIDQANNSIIAKEAEDRENDILQEAIMMVNFAKVFKDPMEIIDALMTSQPFCEFEGLKEKLYKHYEIKK